MAKIKVWTRQHKEVLNILKKEGRYYCKPAYIDAKMENFSDYYKQVYRWYGSKAEKIVPRPSPEIQYPIWVSVNETVQLQAVEDTVILCLEVEEDRLILTDSEKWGYVINFFYLPKDKADLADHLKTLEKMGIGDESEVAVGKKGIYYPLLKQKIVRSWDRLFDPYTLSDVLQGTLWEIHAKNIIQID